MQRTATTVCVIGLGYIGLPTAALLANRGYRVVGVDIEEVPVSTINDGRVHIAEPDLDTFVRAAVDSGRLKAQRVPSKADVFIIAVPTPFNADYSPNLSQVHAAAEAIAPLVEPGNKVILESTCPVGATESVVDILAAAGAPVEELAVAHCPERVLPGRIMIELSENDRIVGGVTQAATAEIAGFYRTFVTGEVLETDARTAEMAKLVENAYRDVEIAFANELSILCDRFGVDVWDLIRLANHHPRVNILQPGPGVGGHCIAVDPWFIISNADGDAPLMETARKRNRSKTEWVIEKVKARAREFQVRTGRRPWIAIMGLAYKPNVEDLRESPALYVAERLTAERFQLLVSEPNLSHHDLFTLDSPGHAAAEADIVVYLVAHKEFFDTAVQPSKVLDFCGVTRT